MNLFVLDHKQLEMTFDCLDFFQTAKVVVPNPCAKLIATDNNSDYNNICAKFGDRFSLFGATAEEIVRCTADAIGNLLYLDFFL